LLKETENRRKIQILKNKNQKDAPQKGVRDHTNKMFMLNLLGKTS